jgi:hypothetical protein
MRCQIFLLLTILQITALPTWARADNSTLQIYVYNHAGVPPKLLLSAEQRTAKVLRLAGIETVWLGCRTADSPGKDCSGLLSADDLVVRIVHNTCRLNDDVFGTAFLNEEGDGKYANVFYDRLTSLERDWIISPIALLGDVMAHEIGHLLLGNNSHSARGIMRAVWDDDQIRKAERGELSFSDAESRRIEVKVAALKRRSSEQLASAR